MVKPCIMGKIILFIIIISLYAFTLNANTIKKASEILPKASDMKGGSSSWIVSGVNEEKRGRCTVYDNTYAYYSNKKEKILDIERSNTYVVSARIFDCDNFGVALDKYKELAEISKKNAKKKQIAPAPFGEQGVMVALPLKNMQGKSQQANYYVTYIFRNFVVQVYSDDGFAQMDMSGEIEKRIYDYLKSKGINYAVNKINLLINTTDNEYIDTLSFTGEQVSSVLITGIVLDINNKPVPNVSIKAMETNQETKTDSNGKFSIVVSSGKGNSISMVKTIFLPFAYKGNRKALSSGFYPLEVKNNNKIIYEALINVLEDNNRVSGYMIDKNTLKRYPLLGFVRGDNVTLDVDCTEPNSVLNCRKIFKGSLTSDYVIEGKAIGAGSGNFTINKKKFIVFTENPYLRDTGAELKLTVIDKGHQKYSSQNNLALNAGEKNRSFLEFNTNAFAGKDMLYFKEAYLKFNVLGVNIKNSADIILYERVVNKSGIVTIHKIAPLKNITNKDNGEIMLDVSSQIRMPSKDGYFIGLKGDEGDFIILNGNNVRLELSYFGDASSYKAKKVISFTVSDYQGDDIVSNKNSIEKDGSPDMVISLKLSAKGRTLEQLEVIVDAKSRRVWNTNQKDIYPSIGVVQDEGILNNDDASISIPLNNNEELFDLHLYKGSLQEEDISKITIKAVIDGKIYEDFISLK